MNNFLNIYRFIIGHPLAGRHKIKALYNFFKWQIRQLIFNGFVECKFVGKTKLLVTKGMTGATGNIYAGLHEFYDMSFLLHFLRSEDTFADIGANVGSYTILASGVIGSRTICMEPIPSTFAALKKNIFLNNLNSKVLALNTGVGYKEDLLYFTNNLDATNHVIISEKEININTIKITVNPLNEILKNEPCPSLIKIDVEGYEHQVINGAAKILENKKLKAIIIELNGSGKNYGFDEENIHQTLLKYNFAPYKYNPFERTLEELITHGSNNTIYIRDLNFVKLRVSMADKVTVFSESF